MADPFSTILSQIANLVSFKSSLRLLLIAASIIFSWVYIQPFLLPFNIQNELGITLLTAIGFSIGALLSSCLFTLSELLIGLVKNKIENKKKERNLIKEQLKKFQADFDKNEILKVSFQDYSLQAKEILLTLLKKDSTIHSHDSSFDPHNIAFLGLLENKIVLPLNRIDKSKTFCTLNPTFKDTVKELFDTIHKSQIDELIASQLDGFENLILKFKENSNDQEFIFDIENIVYINRYAYSPVIRFEEYEDDEFIGNCNIQFYTEDHYHQHLEEALGCTLRDYILGRHDPERGI